MNYDEPKYVILHNVKIFPFSIETIKIIFGYNMYIAYEKKFIIVLPKLDAIFF